MRSRRGGQPMADASEVDGAGDQLESDALERPAQRCRQRVPTTPCFGRWPSPPPPTFRAMRPRATSLTGYDGERHVTHWREGLHPTDAQRRHSRRATPPPRARTSSLSASLALLPAAARPWTTRIRRMTLATQRRLSARLTVTNRQRRFPELR